MMIIGMHNSKLLKRFSTSVSKWWLRKYSLVLQNQVKLIWIQHLQKKELWLKKWKQLSRKHLTLPLQTSFKRTTIQRCGFAIQHCGFAKLSIYGWKVYRIRSTTSLAQVQSTESKANWWCAAWFSISRYCCFSSANYGQSKEVWSNIDLRWLEWCAKPT